MRDSPDEILLSSLVGAVTTTEFRDHTGKTGYTVSSTGHRSWVRDLLHLISDIVEMGEAVARD
jgi:hypothetical protein